MKKTLPAFLAGVIATLAVLGSAYAITTNMTIEVWPINILINGETFQPYDVNGTEVPVFVYNGTTYAPLRALAEAYGLVVGYDGEKNQATVSSPEYIAEQEAADAAAQESTFSDDYSKWTPEQEAGYQEFKAMWREFSNFSGQNKWYAYNGTLTERELKEHLASMGRGTIMAYGKRWIKEDLADINRIPEIVLCYDDSCKDSLDPSDWDNAIMIDLYYVHNKWQITDFKLD